MATGTKNLHVVMLPWSAFGHLIPFYHLATSLANKGVRVSYVSTHRNILRLPKIPSNLSHLMHYISLPTPKLDGNLPEGAEATIDVDLNDIQYLKLAYDLLREPFKQFVLSVSPDWIISDFAGYWTPEVAKECDVKLIDFCTFGATFLSFVGVQSHLVGEGQKTLRGTPESLTTPPPWGEGIFAPSVAFRSYEAAGFHAGFYGVNASGVSDAERQAKILEGSHAIVIRSCNEFEGEFIELFQKLVKKPVLPIGMLPTTTLEDEAKIDETAKQAFKWLDQQSPNSVMYVGFGSEHKLTKDEVYEVAHGLELANVAFLWALRKPVWAANEAEALPPGFQDRTSGKGIVCHGWMPQAKIMGHPSIGGCLVHGGWGSIVETLQHGHNLVMLPFILDQGLNARMLEAKGFCTQVRRGDDGLYTRDDVADALKRAIVGDEAEIIKGRARDAAELFFRREDDYIEEFVGYLRSEA